MNVYESPIYKTAILLKGYHPEHNPGRDYKIAKTPISTCTGFTRSDYKPPISEVITTWTLNGGWVGHLVPEGRHVLDIEDPVVIGLVRSLCRSQGITPPINVTNNGFQFVFATNGGPSLPGADKRITKLGFSVTDRSAGKNYCILPPVNGRTSGIRSSTSVACCRKWISLSTEISRGISSRQQRTS